MKNLSKPFKINATVRTQTSMIIKTEKGNVELGRALFWDINERNIGQALSESDEWVVPRVFEYGTLEEINEIIQYYGRDHTRNILVRVKDGLRPMSKAMAWYYFGLDF